MKGEGLLWERSPTNRGPFSPVLPTLTLQSTRNLNRPEKAFTHSISEEVGDVNEIKGIVEISDMVDEAKANAENIEQVKNATSVDDSLNQEVLMVLEDQPVPIEMGIQHMFPEQVILQMKMLVQKLFLNRPKELRRPLCVV